MKKIILCLMLLALLVGCAPKAETPDKPSAPAENSGQTPTENTGSTGNTEVTVPNLDAPEEIGETPISCMSFNILAYNTGGQELPEPEERAPAIFDFILEQDADIVGIQEASENRGFDWPDELTEAVSDKYGIHRIDEDFYFGGDMGIACGLMVLYRKDRFELIEGDCHNYFEDYNRWYQWVKLKDNKTGKELFVTNTHLSIDTVDGGFAEGNFLRSSEAEELVAFWEETVGLAPLFATGDYNALYGDDPHMEYLTRGIYQNGKELSQAGDTQESVDFVYVNSKRQEVLEYRYLTRMAPTRDGGEVQMSDHAPVMIWCKY